MQPIHLTIGTSSGLEWLTLVLHFAVGLIALVSGFVALAALKAGQRHRQAGQLFLLAMLALGVTAAGIALFVGKLSSIVGGIFAGYLVLTAYAIVQPHSAFHGRQWTVAFALLGTALATCEAALAFKALMSPTRTLDGVPAGMILFFAIVMACAAIGDLRLLQVPGGVRGVQRLARHLWRMCFALFIASGSFFLGQIKFLPESMRSIPLLATLALAPLAALVYWMWRVRIRRRLDGMYLRNPTRSAARQISE
ncbi:MAG: hypothetical protein WCB36_09830 [Burkholderiales bacterium]